MVSGNSTGSSSTWSKNEMDLEHVLASTEKATSCLTKATMSSTVITVRELAWCSRVGPPSFSVDEARQYFNIVNAMDVSDKEVYCCAAMVPRCFERTGYQKDHGPIINRVL